MGENFLRKYFFFRFLDKHAKELSRLSKKEMPKKVEGRKVLSFLSPALMCTEKSVIRQGNENIFFSPK